MMTIRDGILFGRGATDMKSGVAAFVAAAVDFVTDTPPDGAVILAITGDEEGPSTDGTIALLDWMQAEGEAMTACIVGEPTCPDVMGEMIKVGRRGSLTAHFTVTGKQGHSAYPHKALNPITPLARLIDRVSSHELDNGNAHFGPTTLAVTNFDTGNPANNVIPASANARFNIRYNTEHTGQSLKDWVALECETVKQAFAG